MTDFSPRDQFQRHEQEAAAELQKNREQQWLTLGFTFSISQMVFMGATAEQLMGARMFITEFQNLWEKPEKDQKFPVRRRGDYPPELIEQPVKPNK